MNGDSGDIGDSDGSSDDRVHQRLDVSACEEAFRALAASVSSSWSSSALAETVVCAARRLVGLRRSCVRAACLALAQLALRQGRETARVICAGMGQGLARIAVCYAQETTSTAENTATAQDMCVVWCRLVFILAHTLGGDFFDTLLTSSNRGGYTSVRARKQFVDGTTTSAMDANQSGVVTAAVSSGLSSLLLSLASFHESSCMATAAIAMTASALLDAATSAVAMDEACYSSEHANAHGDANASMQQPSSSSGGGDGSGERVMTARRLPVDAIELLSSPCLLSLTDACVVALKRHSSAASVNAASKWLSSLVQGVASAIVKVDPSSAAAAAAEAALINANHAAAVAAIYWSALCLYKLLALSHPGILETPSPSSSPQNSLPADMRSRLLSKVHFHHHHTLCHLHTVPSASSSLSPSPSSSS